MNASLKEQQVISHEEMEERIEEVKFLREGEHEKYTVVKDKTTGEHYIRYTQRHLNLMEGGVEEQFDHLLPVETDDVLAVIFGEQDYEYPANWNRTYLRGSNMDPYVWFDPSEIAEKIDEKTGQEIADMLHTFKEGKKFDDDSIRKLFQQIDELLDEK
jgi:hypothetical protein